MFNDLPDKVYNMDNTSAWINKCTAILDGMGNNYQITSMVVTLEDGNKLVLTQDDSDKELYKQPALRKFVDRNGSERPNV